MIHAYSFADLFFLVSLFVVALGSVMVTADKIEEMVCDSRSKVTMWDVLFYAALGTALSFSIVTFWEGFVVWSS